MCCNYLAPLFLPRTIIADFRKLGSSGVYKSQSFHEPDTETVMLIPSERCNLRCAYCYERRKNHKRMDIQTAQTALQKAFSKLRPGKRLKIEFRGGEPFLEFDFIRHICEWVIDNFSSKDFIFYAITNGTCFTNEVKAWLKRHKEIFFVPLSIDGTRITQNRNRSNSFDLIDFDFIFETWDHPYTSTTISPQNATTIFKDLRFLIDRGFEIRANVEFRKTWSLEELGKLARGFKKLADYALGKHIANHVNLLSRYSFLDYDSNLNESAKEGRKHFLACNAGKHRRIVAADGRIYPCQAFVPSAFKCDLEPANGNLFDMLESEELHPPQCCSCHFLYLCHFCPGFSYRYTGDVKWRNPSLCAITRIRTFLAAYYWGLKLSSGQVDDALKDAKVIMAKIADLYYGEKVYE